MNLDVVAVHEVVIYVDSVLKVVVVWVVEEVALEGAVGVGEVGGVAGHVCLLVWG